MLFRKRARLSTSVLRPGEALVTIGSSPALPVELAPAPTLFLRSVHTVAESDQHDELQPWLRRSVAQWLGVYLEAVSSDDPDNRLRFEWNGDTLFIHRTTWDYSYTAPIETVLPNGRGLYLITSLHWNKLSQAELIGLTKHDRRALETLASDAGPHVAPEMMTYFRGPSTPTSPAEVLVKLPDGPPLPATLADPDSYPEFLDGAGYWGNGAAAFPLFRKPIAALAGLHLEAFYGNAQIEFHWDGDNLAIKDDPWALELGPQPVYPDADGRYLVDRSWWTTLSPEEEVQVRHRHGAALTALESGSGPYDTEDIVALLADRPGAPPDFPARVRELLQAHNWADMTSGHHRSAPPDTNCSGDSAVSDLAETLSSHANGLTDRRLAIGLEQAVYLARKLRDRLRA